MAIFRILTVSIFVNDLSIAKVAFKRLIYNAVNACQRKIAKNALSLKKDFSRLQ